MRVAAICMGLVVSGVILLGGCSANPVSGKNQFSLMTETDEVAEGRQAHQQVLAQNTVYPDAALQNYVSRIGQTMAAQSHRANLAYTFTVLSDPSVNAFALPGGYVYVTTGLLAFLNSEAELAAVLGHEIGHVAARHNVSQASWGTLGNIATTVLSNQFGNAELFGAISDLTLRKYGRDQELEADGLSAEYLARAGYDPTAMVNVIATLQSYDQATGGTATPYRDIFSTHPSNDQRLQQLISQARQQGHASRDSGHDSYLQQINGMRVASKTSQGVQIRVLTAQPGDTFEALAQSSRLRNNAASLLRAMNGLYPNGQPTPGQLVKTVL